MTKERRRQERFSANLFTELMSASGHRLARGIVVDVSLGGLAIETEAGLAVGDVVDCHVELPFKVKAKVVRVISNGQRAVFGLVSKEDRDGLRATVDGYLAGTAGSRLKVFSGLGFGTTMFSTRQFEHGDAEPLEAMIATWLADRLGAQP